MNSLIDGSRLDNWIGGQRCAPRSGSYLPSVAPAFAEPWIEIPASDARDVDDAVAAACAAYRDGWRTTAAMTRAALLRALAAEVTAHAEELATIECRDNGKPLSLIHI